MIHALVVNHQNKVAAFDSAGFLYSLKKVEREERLFDKIQRAHSQRFRDIFAVG